MTLNASLPEHVYGFVRNEFLYNFVVGHGEVTPAVIFGVASHPHRSLGFHVLLETGAVFWRLPVHALCWRRDALAQPLGDLEDWDAFSEHVSVHTFDYLREQTVQARCGDVWAPGRYVTTIDWTRNGYSAEPEQAKCLHLLKLDSGNFALKPTNRVLWKDPSFVVSTTADALGYRALTMAFYSEG